MTSPEVETSGPSLRLVLGCMSILIVVLGVAAYWRYVQSENYFAVTLHEMDRKGKEALCQACKGRGWVDRRLI